MSRQTSQASKILSTHNLAGSTLDIITELKKIQIKGDLVSIARKYSYVGFSFEALYKSLVSKEEDNNKLHTDLMILVTVAMTRGTNLTNIMKRTEPTARKSLFDLIQKYNIKDRAKDSSDSGTLTMSRIMTMLPHLCYEAAKLNLIRDPVGDRSTCHKHLRFTSAPSLISNDRLYNDWLDWAYKFDKIVNPKTSSEENVRRYADISYNSDFFKGMYPELSNNSLI